VDSSCGIFSYRDASNRSYICRQDVASDGYQHFCQHFRPLGGPCKACNKCGLYDKEDEDEAVKEASARAQKEYLARHPTGIELILPGANL